MSPVGATADPSQFGEDGDLPGGDGLSDDAEPSTVGSEEAGSDVETYRYSAGPIPEDATVDGRLIEDRLSDLVPVADPATGGTIGWSFSDEMFALELGYYDPDDLNPPVAVYERDGVSRIGTLYPVHGYVPVDAPQPTHTPSPLPLGPNGEPATIAVD